MRGFWLSKLANAAQLVVHLIAASIGFIIIFMPALLLELAVSRLSHDGWADPTVLLAAMVLKGLYLCGDIALIAMYLISGAWHVIRCVGSIEPQDLDHYWQDMWDDLALLAEILVETIFGSALVVVVFALALPLAAAVDAAIHIPGVGGFLAGAAKAVKVAFLLLDLVLASAFLWGQVRKFFNKIWSRFTKH